MKMELEEILEQKVFEWLKKIVEIKSEKDCKSPLEKDFWKHIVPQFDDPDGGEENALL